MSRKNPFEFEKANNLSKDEIVEYYIEDHNFSRFIQSARNVFLEGERGAGKTMTLLYNSFPIRAHKARKEGEIVDFSKVGVHIPCNTPLFRKREHLLLENLYHSILVTEHFFVLSIASSICKSISEANVTELTTELQAKKKHLKDRLEYLLGVELPDGEFIDSLQLYLQSEALRSQKAMNNIAIDEFVKNSLTFATLIIPLLEIFGTTNTLRDSHFLLMIDDAHDLNTFQLKALNSWIAFRDNTKYSFKVATTKSDRPLYITATGGSIVAGHDFIIVDLEGKYQNRASEFGKMAKKIVERRLITYGIENPDADLFFPMNEEFSRELEECKKIARAKAELKYPNGPMKSITDYEYKYFRVEYFRSKSSKSNRPPYSGFETITSLSTGIVRHLLEPCFWMFDSVVSNQEVEKLVTEIPSSIQAETISVLSTKLWKQLKDGLDQQVEGCTKEQSVQVENLFEQLFVLFKKRLLKHKSEPRAIVFSISEKQSEAWYQLMPLLEVAQKALLLYTRLSTAKDDGKQEHYYVVNRMLIPAFGLDPVGQHARVSLKASDLWNSAKNNRALPFDAIDEGSQPSLFDEI